MRGGEVGLYQVSLQTRGIAQFRDAVEGERLDIGYGRARPVHEPRGKGGVNETKWSTATGAFHGTFEVLTKSVDDVKVELKGVMNGKSATITVYLKYRSVTLSI